MRSFVHNIIHTITAIGVIAVCSSCGTITEELPTYEETSIIAVGDSAPDFTTTLINGSDITLSELRGQVVLLVFFSHTCPDCKALFDDIAAAKSDFEESKVRVLAISRGGEENEIREYISSNNYWFDTAVDSTKEIYNMYATMYVPRTYLINSEGTVIHTTIEYSESHITDILAAAN
jgi:peroxiredoxin